MIILVASAATMIVSEHQFEGRRGTVAYGIRNFRRF
jgi:hypothetical protein